MQTAQEPELLFWFTKTWHWITRSLWSDSLVSELLGFGVSLALTVL